MLKKASLTVTLLDLQRKFLLYRSRQDQKMVWIYLIPDFYPEIMNTKINYLPKLLIINNNFYPRSCCTDQKGIPL